MGHSDGNKRGHLEGSLMGAIDQGSPEKRNREEGGGEGEGERF